MTPPNISLFLIMICFWITMWLVYRFLIRPIGDVMAERSRRIDGASAEWEATNDDYLSATERVEREIEEAARAAAQVRQEHRQRAIADRQETLDGARRAADERLETALTELAEGADRARDELHKRARELARLFATRLLGREVSP